MRFAFKMANLANVIFYMYILLLQASQMVLVVKNPLANAGDIKDTGLIPGLGRSLGEGKGYLLHYSGLENSMDIPWDLKESDMTE